MNASEIERMACYEKDHWWYQGLRQVIARTLSIPRFTLPARPRILDAGCGTGETLRFLQSAFQPDYLGGFDISPQAVQYAKSKVGDADIYQSDIRDPQLHAGRFDLILSCDVISIAGVADSKQGMTRLVDALCSGGIFILNLPAFEWMRSRHDHAIGTRDRLRAAQARELMTSLGLSVELLTYRLFTLFPAVVAMRLPSILSLRNTGPVESDLRGSFRWINSTLAAVLNVENAAMSHGVRFPWGSSVYVVGRKL